MAESVLFRKLLAVTAYAAFIGIFVWVFDGVQSQVYPENFGLLRDVDSVDRAAGRLFLVASPIATALAARMLGWPLALALPVVFSIVCWQAVLPCSNCEDLGGAYEITVISWTVFVQLPVAILGSYSAGLAGRSSNEDPRAADARAVVAYVLLAIAALGGTLNFDTLFGSTTDFLADADSLLTFLLVSTVGTFAAAYQSNRGVAYSLPMIFGGVALLNTLVWGDFAQAILLLGWTAVVVTQCSIAGARFRANRDGGVLQRVSRPAASAR